MSFMKFSCIYGCGQHPKDDCFKNIISLIFCARYTTVDKLQQSYLFIPNKFKVRNVSFIVTVLLRHVDM